MAAISNGILTLTGAIQHRRGTSSALEASEYVPAAGEIIIATDNGEIRAGDGIHAWRDLPSGFSLLKARLDNTDAVHEVVMSTRLTSKQIQQKYLVIPEACDTDRVIRLYLCGLITEKGIDWDVSVDDLGDSVISWDGRGLEALVREGDKVLLNYWERM